MKSSKFNSKEIELLMEAQYNLPLTETPFRDLADRLGMSLEEVIKKLREFKAEGIIKRVGPQLNYKAFRNVQIAALIGAEVKKNLKEVVRRINAERRVKHNFLREHEEYNLWFTIKAESREEIFRRTKTLMEECEIKNYIILPSRRVYKMDVKYDLYRGVSWSDKIEERNEVEKIDGLKAELLINMERNFGIEERPFKKFEEYGYKEGELVDLIFELVEKRVIRDFYAVLNGQNVGFKENGMNLIKTDNPDKVAKKLLRKFPEITHLVLRESNKNWNYPLYFMIHAKNREIIKEIAKKAEKVRGVEEIKILYSLKSFKD